MSNPITDIVSELGPTPHKVLKEKLDGVVSNATFYKLLDEDGIPDKTQWETIVKVTSALGYKVTFQKEGN